jgi:hypothetical protein
MTTASSIKILDKIVVLEGNCLQARRCRSCPFKMKCLPEFTSKKPPSKKKRLAMALDFLMKLGLMDEEGTWESNQ